MASLTANLTLDTSGFTSGINKARTAANNYHQEMSRAAQSIRGLEGNLRVLEMQATGYGQLAESLKATLAIEQQAEKLAASGLITRQKALDLLKKEQLLKQNIATQSAAASSQSSTTKTPILSPRQTGLPELPLTASYLKQTERMSFIANDARNKFNRLSNSVSGTSMGFLAFSQAVEDAQYGIKGVLNNIPQMVLGFGGSMGLAGAISLAAVAAVQLYPLLVKLFKSADAEILKKSSAEFRKIFQEGMKSAKANYENAVQAIKIKQETAQTVEYYRQMTALGQDMGKVYRANIEKLKNERDLQEQIYEVRDRLLKLQGKKTDSQIEDEKAQREIKSLEKELANRKLEQNADSSRLMGALDARRNLTDMEDPAIVAKGESLRALEEELARVEANAGEAKKKIEEMEAAGQSSLRANGKTITTATPAGPVSASDSDISTTIAKEKKRVEMEGQKADALKKQIDAAKKSAQIDEDARKDRVQQIDAEIAKIEQSNQASFDEQKRLEALIESKKKMLAIEQEIQNTGLKSQQDAYKLELDMVRARIAGDEKAIADLERKKSIQEEINTLRKLEYKGKDIEARAASIVDARAAADKADREREGKAKNAGGGSAVAQLGSVAKATNILMGRAANDGLLAENRRQSSLLRDIRKNTMPKETKPEILIPVFGG